MYWSVTISCTQALKKEHKKFTKPKRNGEDSQKSSPRQTLNGYLSAIFGVWFGDKDMRAMVHTIND